MAQESNPLKKVQNKFGKQSLNAGDIGALSNMENQVRSIASKEFDESIKVEGVKSTLEQYPMPNYQSLNKEELSNIETFFKHMTREDFENYQEIGNAEGISSGGEPFKCFAEIDGSGNIIVTPNKMISIKKDKNGSEEYSESRRQSNGNIATVTFKRLFGDLIGCSVDTFSSNLSPEDKQKYTKLKEFYHNPNNTQKLELSGKSQEEQSIYLNELQKLGIQNKKYGSLEYLSEEEYRKAKGNGDLATIDSSSKYQAKKGFKSVSAVYHNQDEQDLPHIISTTTTGPNGENLKFNSYRLTRDGQYLDTSSFRVVNGKPQYTLMSKEEVDKQLLKQGLNIDITYRIRQNEGEQMKDGFPKETEAINNHAERMKDREKEENEQEEEGPQLPSLF